MRIILCSICTMLTLLVFAINYYKAVDRQTIEVPKYTVGVVLKAMDSEHWLAVRSSMQKAAKEHNLNLIVLYATDEAAYREQNKIITDLINNDIDALIISSCNINEGTAYLNLAAQKQIPVFSLDEKLSGIPYIGSDNYSIGQKAAKYMADNLPPGSYVGVIAGSASQDAHIQRTAGFVDYIENHTDLKISTCLADDTKYRQATIQTEKLLAEYPQTDGVFVTSAIMALGAAEVIDNSAKSVKIIGVDTQNDAIMAIKNHKIDAMISQDGNETGVLAINIVMKYLENHIVPQENNYIENNLITLDNADDYLMQEDF
ncbi:sugar ABC transporter substrate-binding protein [Megamonas hypermegale]|uniref:sugar ABC transporter substrate-binding protein n=1 Tax=Megamonas hypermegale TaxID=158847 RepID=UPI0026EFF76B|nr:substrate-binding domain-containing protein [Megamonas hypermegale]